MKIVFKNPYGRAALVRKFSLWLWIGAVLLSPLGLIWVFLAIVASYLVIDHLQTSLLRLCIHPSRQEIMIAYYKPWANFQLVRIPFAKLSFKIEKASLKLYHQERCIITIKANRYGLNVEQMDELSQSLSQLEIQTMA